MENNDLTESLNEDALLSEEQSQRPSMKKTRNFKYNNDSNFFNNSGATTVGANSQSSQSEHEIIKPQQYNIQGNTFEDSSLHTNSNSSALSLPKSKLLSIEEKSRLLSGES